MRGDGTQSLPLFFLIFAQFLVQPIKIFVGKLSGCLYLFEYSREEI